MTELLQSIKSDLLSRQLLPFLALLGVALLAAIAYAATGGSSGSARPPAPSAASGPSSVASSALPVTVAAANPNRATSETPSGTRYQSGGPTRDPFVQLPTPRPAQNTGASVTSKLSSGAGSSSGGSSPSGPGSSGSGSGSGSGPGSGPGGKEAPVPAPKKHAKPQFPYIVSVLFGRASATPGQPATLAPYEGLKLEQTLPSKQDARLSFERVTGTGHGAVFALLVPPILRGEGRCLPSTSECQAIELKVGQTEELEYVEADGQPAVFELKLVSIEKKSAAAGAARAKRAKAARAEHAEAARIGHRSPAARAQP